MTVPESPASQNPTAIQLFINRPIVAGVMFVAPALARWGFHIDAAVIADALIVGGPAAMAIMRAVTRTPLGSNAHA